MNTMTTPQGLCDIPLITYQDSAPNSELRNVKDEYKFLDKDEIIASIDRVPMVNVCMNLTSDFNKASIVRANNVFGGSNVVIVGKKRFDRRGTVGTHHYEHIRHHEDPLFVIEALKNDGYKIFAIDNVESQNPISAYDAVFPPKSAFFYGEEQLGLPQEVIDNCDQMVYISQYGSARSLNVAQAAAVIMFAYSQQNRPRS